MALRLACSSARAMLHRRCLQPLGTRTFAQAAHESDAEEHDKGVPVQQESSDGVSAPPRHHLVFPSLYSSLFPSSMGRSIFRQVEEELNAMMRAFDGESSLTMPATGKFLAMDVQDLDKEYVLTADLPGISKNDIKITVRPDNVLTINGERKHENTSEEGGSKRVERSFGSFQRSFKLPEHVDVSAIKAHSADGVLKLVLPKAEKEQAESVIINVE